MIIMSQTTTGRDKWDTPEVKLAGGKKDRLRKDRYSAILMANMSARRIQRTPVPPPFEHLGGFATHIKSDEDGPDFVGPAWFTENIRGIYD